MIGAIFTAGQLGLAAVQGVAEFQAKLIGFGIRLAVHSHGVDKDAGDEMVDLMRSRVPVDSGRLLNGITSTDEGDAVVVRASAVRGDFDYAKSVEFGHDVAHGDPLGPPRARRSRAEHDSHADAEPYFLNSAEEVLAQRGQSMDAVIGSSARETGL